MLKDLHTEGFSLTKGEVYKLSYSDEKNYYIYDDNYFQVGVYKADEGTVFEIIRNDSVWKDKYRLTLETMGFVTVDKNTYYKEYKVPSEDCSFSIILLPYEHGGRENICVLNFYSDEETTYDVTLTNEATCDLYKDVTLLIMNDIIDANFTVRERCFID